MGTVDLLCLTVTVSLNYYSYRDIANDCSCCFTYSNTCLHSIHALFMASYWSDNMKCVFVSYSYIVVL